MKHILQVESKVWLPYIAIQMELTLEYVESKFPPKIIFSRSKANLTTLWLEPAQKGPRQDPKPYLSAIYLPFIPL